MKRLLYAVLVEAAGGVVLLLAGGRRWGSLTATQPGQARQHVTVTGSALAPALPALGLALLALSVATLAGHGVLRRMAAVMVVVVGVSAVPAALHAHSDLHDKLAGKLFGVAATTGAGAVHGSAWWVVAIVAGVAAAVAGMAVVVNGNRWAAMGRRYDAPSAQAASGSDEPADAWSALDRGEDPTRDR